MPEVKESFDDFFRRDYVRLIAFVRKLGFSYQESEDAASEAMTGACVAWSTLTKPSAWVRTAAHRIAVKGAVRSRERDLRAQSDWVTSRKTGNEDFDVLDDIMRITDLLNRLSEQQRLMMAWHLDGFTTREIAQEVGVVESTVRSTLRHARERLRTMLGPVHQENADHRPSKGVHGHE